MRTRWLLITSLILNGVLLAGATGIAWFYRERLIQAALDWRGKAAVVLFGDSITAQGEWATLLGRCDVRNSGVPGLGIVHLKDMVNEEVVRFEPAFCLVMAGINDLTIMQRGVPEVLSDYEVLLARLRAGGVEPVVQLTLYERADPVSKAKVDSLNARVQAYCLREKITFLDPNQWLSDGEGLRTGYARDKTHLNRAGYERWGLELKKWLRNKSG